MKHTVFENILLFKNIIGLRAYEMEQKDYDS